MKKKNRKSRNCRELPGKGGKTTNFQIPDWMFERELKEYREQLMKEGKANA